MTDETKLYSTREAAEYLGISLPALKYHVYKGHIHPRKVGHSLIFTQAQLDRFAGEKRPPGRPTPFRYETPHETKEG